MRILITGGAGFIGSNLVDHFLSKGFEVVCLDNLSTGFIKNIEHNFKNSKFKFINGDIRNIQQCYEATEECDYVCHQAALGSVPRSIEDPISTNSVNIEGFLNVLIAARDKKVKRFVYAASSSTYGDSKKIPKVEDEIGKPLSPYAITKVVNEQYADIFAKTYGMQCIGLRYFNVFGKRQDPNGAYAAVIPLWAKKMINYEQPIINGDGSYSRDFTYIDDVIQANEKSFFISESEILNKQKEYYNMELDQHKYLAQKNANNFSHKFNIDSNEFYFSEVFNVAFGGNTTLLELFDSLKRNLIVFDSEISKIEPIFGPFRVGDIPHSQASILKAKTILGYKPVFDVQKGFELTAQWYFNNLNSLGN